MFGLLLLCIRWRTGFALGSVSLCLVLGAVDVEEVLSGAALMLSNPSALLMEVSRIRLLVVWDCLPVRHMGWWYSAGQTFAYIESPLNEWTVSES